MKIKMKFKWGINLEYKCSKCGKSYPGMFIRTWLFGLISKEYCPVCYSKTKKGRNSFKYWNLYVK
jgi:hypothetical protein